MCRNDAIEQTNSLALEVYPFVNPVHQLFAVPENSKNCTLQQNTAQGGCSGVLTRGKQATTRACQRGRKGRKIKRKEGTADDKRRDDQTGMQRIIKNQYHTTETEHRKHDGNHHES
jgi:hypothetical protein